VSRVALILVGTEILTGKVRDLNAPALVDAAAERGHDVTEIRVVHDVTEAIVRAVRELATSTDLLVTSGGIGPTIDDITVPAVAEALHRDLVHHPVLQRAVDVAFGHNPEQHRVWSRMAWVPEGTQPIESDAFRWPIVHVQNVACLPGVPALFARQLPVVLGTLPIPVRRHRAVLYVSAGEGVIAEPLAAVAAAFRDVAFGSYPVFGAERFSTRLTVEGVDEATVREALGWMEREIGTSVVEVAWGERILRDD